MIKPAQRAANENAVDRVHRQLLDALAEPVLLLDRDTRVVFANSEATLLLGTGATHDCALATLLHSFSADDRDSLAAITRGCQTLMATDGSRLTLRGREPFSVAVSLRPWTHSSPPLMVATLRRVDVDLTGTGPLPTRNHAQLAATHHIALVLDGSGRISFVNRAWRDFAIENGAAPELIAGVGIDYLAVCESAEELSARSVAIGIREVMAKKRRSFSHVYRCHSDVQLRWFRMDVIALEDDRQGVLLTHTDITEVYVANTRLNIQVSLVKALQSQMPLLESCRELAVKVCEDLDWDYAGIWTIDTSSWTLKCVDTWLRGGLDLSAFQRGTYQAALGPGIGLPGRAWMTAKVQWATDLDAPSGRSSPPNIMARVMPPLAIASGFRTAISFPIKCGDDVLAVVDLFSRVRRPPDALLMEILHVAGDQLALWELRERAESCARTSQQEADDARALLESMISCAPAYVTSMDRSGTIQFVNRTFAPRSADMVVGTHWQEYCPQEWHPLIQSAFEKVLATGKTQLYEVSLDRPDGPTVWLANHMGPMRSGDVIVGVVVISQDITETKHAQSELVEAQRLAAVGTLAAGVAHEINTPVQFVNDSLHFLRDAGNEINELLAKMLAAFELARKAPLDEETSAALAAVQVAAEEADLEYLVTNTPKAYERAIEGLERVATIVRSMKEFAHPAQKEMALADLNRAITATLTVARNEYKYVADVVSELGELPLVNCHLNEINQVVLNIVVNAAHAIADKVRGTEQRGTITLRTYTERDFAVISIADNGGGIPEHVQPRIFDPFFTTKEVGVGTGQGLAIARTAIRESHGGELSFETVLGQGTTFYIRLPIAGKH